MGIIQRQAIKNSVIKYVAVGIGVLSVLFVYSNYTEIYGLYTFLFSSALLLSPFIQLGAAPIAIRYHPKNNSDPATSKGFFTFITMLVALGSLTLCVLVFIFDDWVQHFFLQEKDDPNLVRYFFWMLPLAVLVGAKTVVRTYIANYHRIVVPEIVGNLWIKVSIPILVLGVGVEWINLDTFVHGIIVVFSISLLLQFLYLLLFERQLFQVPAILQSSKQLFATLKYGAFSVFNSIGNVIAVRIDTIMVAKITTDLGKTGAYGILAVLMQVVQVPRNSIYSITAPIIAKHIKQGNIKEVGKVYRSSSLLLLIAGLFVAGGIYINISDLVQLFGDVQDFDGFLLVTTFLALAYVFDMATSVNTHIIVYSKYYKVNLYLSLLLAAITIILNLLFIPEMGISGAALSTLCSMTVLNLSKLAFIYIKYGIQPFTLASLYTSIIAFCALSIVLFIPTIHSIILDMVIRSAAFTFLFILPVFLLRLSSDFNHFIHKVLSYLPFGKRRMER